MQGMCKAESKATVDKGPENAAAGKGRIGEWGQP